MYIDHYICQRIIPHDTKAEQISDMVELHHRTITAPVVTLEDPILQWLTTLKDAFMDASISNFYAQIQAITTPSQQLC